MDPEEEGLKNFDRLAILVREEPGRRIKGPEPCEIRTSSLGEVQCQQRATTQYCFALYPPALKPLESLDLLPLTDLWILIALLLGPADAVLQEPDRHRHPPTYVFSLDWSSYHIMNPYRRAVEAGLRKPP